MAVAESRETDREAQIELLKQRIGEGLQRVNRFWAGEAEVARVFFEKPRTEEEHLFWLKSQMLREFGAAGAVSRVADAYKRVETELERHQVHEQWITSEEEYSHYVVLADIAEEIAGRRILPEEILYNRDLPESKALSAVRTRGSDWDAAVSGFHEGGGLGIYFTCMNIKPMDGDPYRPEIAEAMAMIYGDELEHASKGLRAMVRVAVAATNEEWEQVLQKVELVGYHRVRMRNEQFGFPLPESRIEEIKAGKILPYIPPLPTVEEAYDRVISGR